MNPIESLLSRLSNQEQQLVLLATQLGQIENELSRLQQSIDELRTIQANLRND